MLYTNGFVLAGALATALVLAALYNSPDSAAPQAGAADVDALHSLSEAIGSHSFPRDRLAEPDHALAGYVRDAADLTGGHTRDRLLTLADSASRSALEFLVDYNLAAGGWEAATGLRMSPATPVAG